MKTFQHPHRIATVFAALAAILSIRAPAKADTALSLGATTLGASVQLTESFNPNLNVRLWGNYFPYSYGATYSSVDYNGKLTLASGLALLDWYPFGGIFHLSAGGLVNGNKIQLSGTPTGGAYTINGDVYTAAQIGTLTEQVTFGAVAPYFGIGFGNPIVKSGHWSVHLDLGAAYQGDPKLAYTVTGAAANSPMLINDLNVEQGKVQTDLDTYFRFYPVIGLSIGFKF